MHSLIMAMKIIMIKIKYSGVCYNERCCNVGVPVGGRPVHGTATYRCNDTRDCIIQFWPPDDEHMCSKHVEA